MPVVHLSISSAFPGIASMLLPIVALNPIIQIEMARSGIPQRPRAIQH